MSKPDKNRPKPIIEKRSRIQDTFPCPQCGHECRKHRLGHRKLQSLNYGRPLFIELTYSVHYCPKCEKHFNIDMSDLAAPGSHYTNYIVEYAIHLVLDKKLSYREASRELWRESFIFVPFATIPKWVKAKKRKEEMPAH